MEFINLKAQYQTIKGDLLKEIEQVLNQGQFILGEQVAQLETKLANYVGVKHCITNANGTDALVLALRALNIGNGDEVIVPSFTFFASAEAVTLVGATPVFVDIDEKTYNVTADIAEKFINKNTKAIIAVSLYGLCPDLKKLIALCEKNNVALIEDAAQSFGAEFDGKKSCSLATISCTSFFPSKPLGAYGDGGACFTNNGALAKKLKELRTHGQEKRYHHTDIGYNSRLDTVQAAILLKKLEIFPNEVVLRNKIAANYQEAFKGNFKIQEIPAGYTSVYAQFTIEVSNREEFQKKLNEVNIPTAVHYPIPLHKQPVYLKEYAEVVLPKSESASARVVSLPMHPYLTTDEQAYVIENVLKFGKN